MRGGGDDALRLRRIVATRPRGHGGGNRVSVSRHVVVRHPAAQIANRGRQVRLLIQHCCDIPSVGLRIECGIMADDAADDHALPYRHAHTRANRRQPRITVWNVVGEGVEIGNRDGDRDELQSSNFNLQTSISISFHSQIEGRKLKMVSVHSTMLSLVSYPPILRVWPTASAAGTLGDTSASESRPDTCTRARGAA